MVSRHCYVPARRRQAARRYGEDSNRRLTTGRGEASPYPRVRRGPSPAARGTYALERMAFSMARPTASKAASDARSTANSSVTVPQETAKHESPS